MRRLTAVTLLLVGLVMAGCGGGTQYTASVDSVDPGSAFYTVNWAVTNQASAGLSMTCQVSLAQGTTEVAQGTPFQISVPQGETDRQSSTIITGNGVEIQNPTGHIVCSNVTSTG